VQAIVVARGRHIRKVLGRTANKRAQQRVGR
jgi:hypothetical protein